MTATSPADPGSAASAAETFRFAEAYRTAAVDLLASACGPRAVGHAPARFCAVHAIELYLDAFLRALGESPCRLRAHNHNLGMRAALAMSRGLTLRRKTALHLVRLTADREHLALRYGPERIASVCELNRLIASLEEIAHVVRHAAERAPDSEAAVRPGRRGAPDDASAGLRALPPADRDKRTSAPRDH